VVISVVSGVPDSSLRRLVMSSIRPRLKWRKVERIWDKSPHTFSHHHRDDQSAIQLVSKYAPTALRSLFWQFPSLWQWMVSFSYSQPEMILPQTIPQTWCCKFNDWLGITIARAPSNTLMSSLRPTHSSEPRSLTLWLDLRLLVGQWQPKAN